MARVLLASAGWINFDFGSARSTGIAISPFLTNLHAIVDGASIPADPMQRMNS